MINDCPKIRINVTDVTDRACACLKSVLLIGVDKDHWTLNWVLILYQTCTTNEMNGRQELRDYSGFVTSL